MSYMPRFAEPAWLILLVAVPFCIYLGLQIRSLTRGRKWTAVFLRAVIVTCVVLALAGTEIVRTSDRLAVFFLLDHSNSISESLRLAATQTIRNLCDAHMTDKDEAGVIVFGGDASIELNVAPTLGLREVRSYVGGEQTDLAAALRLAMAAFPQGYMRRAVVLTDGNETRGSALEEVKQARTEDISVDVLPIHTGGQQEVRVREVSAPNQSNADEPFQLRIVVNAEQSCSARLQVYQRAGERRHMLAPQDVNLQPGDNVFVVKQELAQAGFYEYEVAIESEADTMSENNVGRAFTTVYGEPSVLYVAGEIQGNEHLETALKAEGVDVTTIHPHKLPMSLAQLQNYDSVIMANVSSTDITAGQLALLEAMVRDLGIGLVMVGGPDTFGPGGYLDTPIERALPVSMDIKQRKIMPRGALALILHTCEIADGNVWAREIALASLNVLSAQDLMGALAYDWQGGDSWVFELQPVGDKSRMRAAITKASTHIGDMPDTQPTLALAYNGLVDVDASVKRAILISDGDPAAPLPRTLKAFAQAGIAVSTVCISPHSSSDQNMLKKVAKVTGGQYYYVTNPNNLPQIFTKEAAVVKRGMLIEEEFVPQVLHDSELLQGLAETGLPPLLGYVVTMPKDTATLPLVSHKEDPVLAHWRYGLGKTAAYTSDATRRWAASWVDWEGFNRFWAQTVRWSLRELTPSSFRVETKVADGPGGGSVGHIRVDAVDEDGQFVNFLAPRGVVTSPEFGRREVELDQTAPGIYEGTFPVDESGVYMVNLTYTEEDGGTGMIPTGLAVDYSPEYENHTTNLPLLEAMAEAGGGTLMDDTDSPFEHNLVASLSIEPVWPYLAALAACLLPLEIFVRRVMIPWGLMLDALLAFLRWLPALGRYLPKAKRREAPVTGHYHSAVGPAATAEAAEEPVEGLSFGQVTAPAVTPVARQRPAERGEDGPAPEERGRTSYTSRLLEAKDRAAKQEQERKSRKDKENGS